MNISQAFKALGDQHLQEQNLLSKGFTTIKDYFDSKILAKDPEHLIKCGLAIRDNKELVMRSVCHEGALFQFASDSLKDDKEVLFAAIANDDNLKSSIESDYSPLKYASKRLQGDKEAVLFAIKERPLAFEYASAELKNSKEVVLAALSHESVDDTHTFQTEIIKHTSVEIQEIAGTTQPRENIKKAIKSSQLSNKLESKLAPKIEAPTKKMKI